MDLERIALNADAVSIMVIVFVPLAAATLVPAVHKLLPWPLEVLIWVGLIAVSLLRVAGITDAHIREATLSAAWAGGQLINTQIAALEGAIRTWLVDNRFGIATLAIAVAGADVLLLALIRSHRAARRAMPQVRLGEWFVMPARSAAPVDDPIAELDRKLGSEMRTGLEYLAPAARAVFVKPFAHAVVHVLGPGPARLRMVKLALGFAGHDDGSKPVDVVRATPAVVDGAAAASGDPGGRAAQPVALGAAREHRGPRRHRRGWWQVGSAARLDAPRKAAPDQVASALRREVKDGGAPRQADRLAS